MIFMNERECFVCRRCGGGGGVVGVRARKTSESSIESQIWNRKQHAVISLKNICSVFDILFVLLLTDTTR